MTGFIVMTGLCGCCRAAFGFNPNKVPAHNGKPICQRCMDVINARRIRAGLNPFPVEDGAYDPTPEDEIDFDLKPRTVYPVRKYPPDEAC